MWTMMIPVVAAALLVQPADSVTVTGVVVDPAGKPVSDVEVVLAGRSARGRIGPHAGTDDDRRSRGIPPRGRPATVAGNRTHSGHLGLPSRPDGRHGTGRSHGESSDPTGPTDPGRAVETDPDDPRSR